ncbi:MAG: HAMP domain-containing sensor histidine kinase [Dehalococcoidia bacterium]
MMEELLDTARLTTGLPLALNRTPIDLVALARRVLDAHQRLASGHQLRLDADPPGARATGTRCGWNGDRQLRAARRRHSPDGGVVTVQVACAPAPTAPDGDATAWAMLTVTDEGVGIPAADLPYVFEPFRRGGNVAGIHGSGIGLAGARRVVEQHGGALTVASAAGRGSVFTMRLPLA